MKDIIKKILRENILIEEMKPTLGDNFTEKTPETNLLLVATDENNDKEHYLVLGVDLVKGKYGYELGYGFSIMDINLIIVSSYMRTRDEVGKYLPIELKGKLMPKIIQMITNLVNKINPKIIVMDAIEKLEGDSLKRHEKITDTLIGLGYKIKEGYPKKDSEGKYEWVLLNSNVEGGLNEELLLEFIDKKKRQNETTRILEERYNNMFNDEEFRKKFIKEQITNNKHIKNNYK